MQYSKQYQITVAVSTTNAIAAHAVCREMLVTCLWKQWSEVTYAKITTTRPDVHVEIAYRRAATAVYPSSSLQLIREDAQYDSRPYPFDEIQHYASAFQDAHGELFLFWE